MKCVYCSSELQEEWMFCPFCGSPKSTAFKAMWTPQELEEEIKKLHRILTDTLGSEIRSGGVSIKIENVDGKPDIQIKRFGDLEATQEESQLPLARTRQTPRMTSEPEAVLQRIENCYVLKVKMPDVSEEDIDVLKFENSIEVRGYVGDKVYFKVIEIPPNGKIIYRKLEDGVLTVKISA